MKGCALNVVYEECRGSIIIASPKQRGILMPRRCPSRRCTSSSFWYSSGLLEFCSFRMTIEGRNHSGSKTSNRERTELGAKYASQSEAEEGGPSNRKTCLLA